MKIALIGGDGFVGRPTAKALLDDGHDVCVLNRSGISHNKNIEAISIDRSDPEKLVRALDYLNIDSLIDVIAYTFEDTTSLLDALNIRGGGYVLLSSIDVYKAFGRVLGTETGETSYSAISETSPLRENLFPYEKTGGRQSKYDKIPIEKALQTYSNLDSRILRLPMMFGPNDPRRRFKPVVDALMSKTPLELTKIEADWIPSMLFVNDAASGIAACCSRPSPSGFVMHLGPDNHPTWSSHALGFAEETGRKLSLNIVDDEEKPLQNLVIDSSKTRQLINWAPSTPIEDAYLATWDWENSMSEKV